MVQPPETGQGALVTEKWFKGADPKVPQAEADARTPRDIDATGRQGVGPNQCFRHSLNE